MTPAQFDRAAGRCRRLAPHNRDAARLVLVDGRAQADVARELGMPRQRVSQSVRAVLRARPAARRYPSTWRTVTVTVPRELAREIGRMARDARAAMRVTRDQDGGDTSV